MFFDTFSHDAGSTVDGPNLDLVQFSRPVVIRDVRIIPLGTKVQAEFPGGGFRLGATNPSQFPLELYVTNLNKKGASAFEPLGVLNYKHNQEIQFIPGSRVPTDGLVLRGLYCTITVAVFAATASVPAAPNAPGERPASPRAVEVPSPPPPPPPAPQLQPPYGTPPTAQPIARTTRPSEDDDPPPPPPPPRLRHEIQHHGDLGCGPPIPKRSPDGMPIHHGTQMVISPRIKEEERQRRQLPAPSLTSTQPLSRHHPATQLQQPLNNPLNIKVDMMAPNLPRASPGDSSVSPLLTVRSELTSPPIQAIKQSPSKASPFQPLPQGQPLPWNAAPEPSPEPPTLVPKIEPEIPASVSIPPKSEPAKIESIQPIQTIGTIGGGSFKKNMTSDNWEAPPASEAEYHEREMREHRHNSGGGGSGRNPDMMMQSPPSGPMFDHPHMLQQPPPQQHTQQQHPPQQQQHPQQHNPMIPPPTLPALNLPPPSWPVMSSVPPPTMHLSPAPVVPLMQSQPSRGVSPHAAPQMQHQHLPHLPMMQQPPPHHHQQIMPPHSGPPPIIPQIISQDGGFPGRTRSPSAPKSRSSRSPVHRSRSRSPSAGLN